jgi:hydroxymethylpyrimidine/phosphomethylpyrimidine kinase
MLQFNVVNLNLYDKVKLECITPIRKDNKLPTVMTVAGSDSSGGAGIEADIKTITTNKCYALTCIDFLTAQNTTGVINALGTDEKIVTSILDQNFSDIPIDSIKTGLLTEEAIFCLKNAIEKYNYKGILVVDPVMVSTSGYDFVSNKIIKSITDHLSPFITLITPNMIEAKVLINTITNEKQYDNNPLGSLHEMFEMCYKISKMTGIKNVLLKGGHQEWADEKLLTDVLYCSEKNTHYVIYSEKLVSVHTHGTGCTLSSAIASNLASGLSIINAVANGIVYVQNGIKMAPELGSGNGPLNHIQNVVKYNHEAKIQGTFTLPFNEGGVLEYLYNHPQIKESWEQYTNHEFMESIVNSSLKLENFKRFCEQNILYLISYQHALSFLLAKLNDFEDVQNCLEKLNLILDEVAKYKNILLSLGHTEDDIDKIEPIKECKDYMDALIDLSSNTGDILDIVVAMLPCCHGYYLACNNSENKNDCDTCFDLRDTLYSSWINEVLSESYYFYLKKEELRLNKAFKKYCLSEVKLQRAVEIFYMFTELEIKFLNSFLNKSVN